MAKQKLKGMWVICLQNCTRLYSHSSKGLISFLALSVFRSQIQDRSSLDGKQTEFFSQHHSDKSRLYTDIYY